MTSPPHPSVERQQQREARRKTCVAAVLAGMTQTEAARHFGVHPTTVYRWMDAYRTGGDYALKARPLGPIKKKALPPVRHNDPRLGHWRDDTEKRRRQTIAAILGGMSQAEAARQFGAAPSSVSRWMAMLRTGGPAALSPMPMGLLKSLPALAVEDLPSCEDMPEPLLRAFCLQALHSGLSARQTGLALGLARETVCAWAGIAPEEIDIPGSALLAIQAFTPSPLPFSQLSHPQKEWVRKQAVLAARDGLSFPQTARAFGVSRGAVAKWLQQVRDGGGLHALAHRPPRRPSKPPPPKTRKRDARKLSAQQQTRLRSRGVAMVREGISIAATARTLGVDPSTVRRWMTRYRQGGHPALTTQALGRQKLPKTLAREQALQRHKDERAQLRQDCIAAVLAGMPQVQAAKHFGLSKDTVCLWMKPYRAAQDR